MQRYYTKSIACMKSGALHSMKGIVGIAICKRAIGQYRKGMDTLEGMEHLLNVMDKQDCVCDEQCPDGSKLIGGSDMPWPVKGSS